VHRVEGLAPGVYRYWPEHSELEKIKHGDRRLIAASLSLGQDLAANACVASSMIGDLKLLNLRATGMGAFFDDEVAIPQPKP
jgi:hypothetical protein